MLFSRSTFRCQVGWLTLETSSEFHVPIASAIDCHVTWRTKSKPGSVSSKPRAYTRLDASAHREGFLSIRQSLNELHHGNKCQPKGAPRQGAHSAEIRGQRTRLAKSFPKHRACSWRDCLEDRLHEPHGPFHLVWRTHVASGVSSSFSSFSLLLGLALWFLLLADESKRNHKSFPTVSSRMESQQALRLDILDSLMLNLKQV